MTNDRKALFQVCKYASYMCVQCTYSMLKSSTETKCFVLEMGKAASLHSAFSASPFVRMQHTQWVHIPCLVIKI